MEIRRRLLIALLSCAASAAITGEEISFVPWRSQTGIPASLPCEVHVQAEPGGAEEVFPCGRPIELNDPDSIVWLEQGGWITRFGSRGKDLMARDGATVELPLGPGAYVVLDPDLRLSPKERVEIRHYNSSVHDRIQLTPIIRPIEPGQQVLIPVGSNSIIALRYYGEDLVGVTQNFHLPPTEVTKIPRFRPAVFAHITWPDPSWKDWGKDLDLILRQEETARKPEVHFQADDHAIAVWYGMPAGDGEIALESDEWYVADQVVTIEDGLVTSIDLELVDRVDLDVSVALADDVEPENEPKDLHLLVRHVRSEEVIAEADVSLEGTTTIEGLPPLPVDLVLKVDGTDTFQPTDLSTGGPQSVHFELDPIVVEGTVTHGGEPTRAEIRFTNALVETDEYGDYQITLWQPTFYLVRTTIPGMDVRSAHIIHLRINDDRELDIDIPRNEYVVQVSDAVSGAPVTGANVSYMNRHMVEPEPGSGREAGRQGNGGMAETDEHGVAKLPPLNPGALEMGVRAEGYDDWETEMQVIESDQPQIIEARLQPTEATGTLTLRLPNGAPAVDAEVVATTSVVGLAQWGRTTDEHGKVMIPDLPADINLIAYHRDGALIARHWDPVFEPNPVWQLPPAAPPLTIQFEHANGEPAYHPTVMIWIDGIRISGVHSSGSSQADQNGLWIGRRLPPQPLRILALRFGSHLDPQSQSLEALAEVVPYPWPAKVVLTVVE